MAQYSAGGFLAMIDPDKGLNWCCGPERRNMRIYFVSWFIKGGKFYPIKKAYLNIQQQEWIRSGCGVRPAKVVARYTTAKPQI